MRTECICGLTYDNFNSELTFSIVAGTFWVASDNPKDWVYKRRNSVLGRWHQMKREMWEKHIDGCMLSDIEENGPISIDLTHVPF